MALSTSMPIAIINAPSEMRCRLIPSIAINAIVPSTVSSRTLPTTVPARQPIKRHSAPTTVTTDNVRLRKNVLIASLTT